MSIDKLSKEDLFARARARSHARHGALIAAAAVVLATLLGSLLLVGSISIEGIILAQTSNAALWVLDVLPFAFVAWGQYAGESTGDAGGSAGNGQQLRSGATDIEGETRARAAHLSTISHELCVPLNGIAGMIDQLLETPLDRQQRQYASIIKDSAGSLVNLINDILDFCQMEAGKLPLDERVFDLRACLEGALALLAPAAQAKALRLRTLVQSTLPDELVGDPGRLRQLFVNVVSLAIDRSSKGEIAISARIGRETESEVILLIEAQGTGACAAEIRADEPLNRPGERFASRRFGATGLALAISTELARAMGGDIDLSGEERRGGALRFSVALRKAPAPVARVRNPVLLAGLKVLVVDENPALRDAVVEDLSAAGLDVLEARDGNEALRQARAAASQGRPFDIIVTDMFTPGRNGEELGREIKSLPETRDAALIIMTSVGQRGDAQRLADVGFSAYINKPIKTGQLERLIAGALAMSDMTEEERRRHGLVTLHTLQQRDQKKRPRALLAEDSAVNRERLQHTLAKLGFQVDIAIDGNEAVEAARRHTYNLIFMDYHMPALAGPDAIAAIRALGCPSSVAPAIVLTSEIGEDDRRACVERGASIVLVKPISMGDLVKNISSLVALPATDDAPKSGTSDDLAMIFLKESAIRLQSLVEAIALADAPRVAREAHTMKGISKQLDAHAAGEIAARIEQLAETPDLAAASLLVPTLERELDAFCARVRAATPDADAAATPYRAV